MNLRWTWHPPTQDLFASLDPEAWERSGHDPVRAARRDLLGPVRGAGRRRRDRRHRARARRRPRRATCGEPRWYQGEREDDPTLPAAIGYFSMEFGVSEVLPNYSGGLGVLAGDHLKAASDLGVPLVGGRPALPVGLLPPVAVARRLAAGDLPRPRPAGPAAAAADRRDGRAGARHGRDARRAARQRAGLARPRSAGCRCCCSTPTSRRTTPTCAASPTGSTAATRTTGSARRSWSASAACARCAPTARSPGTRSPRCSTRTRATRATWAWSASAS